MTATHILWQPARDILTLGPFTLHWYSFCWLVGLMLAYVIVMQLYRRQHIPWRSSSRCSSTASRAFSSAHAWATACSTNRATS